MCAQGNITDSLGTAQLEGEDYIAGLIGAAEDRNSHHHAAFPADYRFSLGHELNAFNGRNYLNIIGVTGSEREVFNNREIRHSEFKLQDSCKYTSHNLNLAEGSTEIPCWYTGIPYTDETLVNVKGNSGSTAKISAAAYELKAGDRSLSPGNIRKRIYRKAADSGIKEIHVNSAHSYSICSYFNDIR